MLNSYWEYAGTRYKTKIKAIEASGGDISSISFFAFTDYFYSYSWNKEPTESWEELLLERALILREKYKYLKLWFSGGADSTTVLNTFLRNNIHIDEIIVYRFALNDNFLNKSNHEIDGYTTPFLKNIQNAIPNTKITYMDFGKDYYDKYLGEKWLHTKSTLDLRNFHIPKIRGKNYCNIFCDLTPDVYYDKGSWYSDLWDTSHLSELAVYNNIELFYSSDEFPKLHAKQLHLVKSYLKDNNITNLRTNTAEYKQIIRNVARVSPVVSVSSSFIKTKTVSLFNNPKNIQLLKCADDLQLGTYRSLLSTKIKGKLLINLFIGYKAGTLSLGE
jgi:hypothetical protein